MKIKLIVFVLMLKSTLFAQEKPMGFGLEMFKNIEQIEYCLPLPLAEINELSGSERCKHSFVDKKNKNTTIDVQGFYREDTTISLETYFGETYNEEKEGSGKIVTQKEILIDKSCYYAIGYYNNFLGKYEFAEITWVRKDEVMKLQLQYPTKDKDLWYERVKIIIKNAYCR